MTPYKSRSGKPYGAVAYEIGEDSIIVKFKNGLNYLYTYESAGISAVETMKRHALNSLGLSTYIVQEDPKYASKF